MLAGMIGQWELLLIFFAILLLFGARRLPELAQGLGKGIREFRRAVKEPPEEESKTKGKVSAPPQDQGGSN
ncbi:MAG: twin-arginine translocase TatA/TatE family subunit [bacterium]|jgi:sec-independent protein translocase protein TatA|nr:twin-arginine translocase TatA/TatE family subunit [candidate division KSB1 bacterium]MDH7561059.1 twin-arginine translocase TatA/TatE family subunit [bacterium]